MFTADLNWTRNKLQKLTEPVDTLLFTPRVGRTLVRKGELEFALWTGTMFQNIGTDTNGSIRLGDTIEDPDALRDKVDDWYNGLTPPQQALVRGIVDRLDPSGDPVVHYRLKKRVQYP